jgi:hypothetical protein
MKKLAPSQKPEYGIKKIYPIFAKQCNCCKYYYRFIKMWKYQYVENFMCQMPETFINRSRWDYQWLLYLCFNCASSLADVIRYREGGHANKIHKITGMPTVTSNTPIPEFKED